MKLARLGAQGAETLAILDDAGRYRDISTRFADLTPALLADLSVLAALTPEDFPVLDSATRVGPCIPRPGKFICVGLNYSDNAAETGMAHAAHDVSGDLHTATRDEFRGLKRSPCT